MGKCVKSHRCWKCGGYSPRVFEECDDCRDRLDRFAVSVEGWMSEKLKSMSAEQVKAVMNG